MDKYEQEYRLFMLKLEDKLNEFQRDFEKLSPENKERVNNSMSYLAIMELLKHSQNNKY